jgi:hypothetical protein
MNRIRSFREPGPRYATLRVIAFLSTLCGGVLLIGGVGLLIFALYNLPNAGDAATRVMNPEPPFPGPNVTPMGLPALAWFSLLWSFAALVGGFQLAVLGAFLRLMIHVEENTRATAQVLDGLRSRSEASPGDAPQLFAS